MSRHINVLVWCILNKADLSGYFSPLVTCTTHLLLNERAAAFVSVSCLSPPSAIHMAPLRLSHPGQRHRMTHGCHGYAAAHRSASGSADSRSAAAAAAAAAVG